ncbi:MAG: class I SAM-dependent methyltransferase [Candidatus Aminicenantes bacterium]|nr:class I SAM-dependent methyltransferase [Candidatus Aminicenantes bacterium]
MDKEQLDRIRLSYDSTVRDFLAGISPLVTIPRKFKKSKAFKSFLKETDPLVTGSSNPDIKEFLEPDSGQNCLDVGCCANLATKRFDKWPSTYYGIDISSVLIQEMKKFIDEGGIKIGGLEVAEMKDLPFSNDFFDIAMVIGVFEYVSMDYAALSLKELYRVLKPGAKMVLDLPNPENPHIETMFQLEEYLQRPNIPKPREKFEHYLKPLFSIVKTNDKHVMLKYFVEKR